MHRSRSKSLKLLRIRKQDLEAIWAFLKSCHDIDLAQAQANAPQKQYLWPGPPKVSVSSIGSMSTVDDSGAIFQNDVIDRQKSYSVGFRYWPSEPKKSIDVDLTEGSSSFNRFSVSGDNTAWVDATYAELERFFDSVPPQNNFYRKYRRWITTVLAISIGWTIRLVVEMVTTPPLKPPQWIVYLHAHPVLDVSANTVICYFVGIFEAVMVSGWVASLWPSVEFDFGPEHLKSQKTKRTRLGVLASLVIAPFVLALFQRFVLDWR